MQINSIPAYSLGVRNLRVTHPENTEPAPAQTQTQEPDVKQIYFRGGENGGHSMRNATMAVLVPLTMLTAGGGIMTGLTSCGDKYDIDTAYANANANANAEANAHADTSAVDTTAHKGDSCHHCGPCGRDTLWKTKWDTVYIDTGSYVHDVDTIIKWKDGFRRPLPLDTLSKHMKIFDIDGADTIKNRNVFHYEYTREWEYNNRVIANMNLLESSMDKNVLVHDVEVKDYKGNHVAYEKHVRRQPIARVNLQNYDGTTTKTANGIFLEIRENENDLKGASVLESTLKTRYFLQTAGDSVKVYKYIGGNDYVEDGRIGKGYIDENTILLKDLIGEYATDEHLSDVVIKNVDDDTLVEMYARARDNEDQNSYAAVRTRSDGGRTDDRNDPNALDIAFKTAAWRYE